MNTELTAERLRELVSYDKKTGVFRREKSVSNISAGSVCGCHASKNSYCHIKIDGKTYYAHRLAFLFVEGAFPKNEVDHIDGNRLNNAWENLRHATRSENEANKLLRKDNTSRYRGVVWLYRSKRWTARISRNGKCIHLGTFSTAEEASTVYKAAELAICGEYSVQRRMMAA